MAGSKNAADRNPEGRRTGARFKRYPHPQAPNTPASLYPGTEADAFRQDDNSFDNNPVQQQCDFEYHKLQERNARLRELVSLYAELYDCAPVGYIVHDIEGIIHYINRIAAQLLDADTCVMKGMQFGTCIAESDRHLFSRHLRDCTAVPGRNITTMLHIRTLHQQMRIQCVSTAVPYGTTCYIQSILLDLSDSSRAYTILPAADLLHRHITEADTRTELDNLRRENSILHARIAQLQSDLETRKHELAALALERTETYECLISLEKKLKKTAWSSPSASRRVVRDVLFELRQSLRNREHTFDQQLSEANRQFIKTITSRFPDLTPVELKLCCLLRMNLSTKEVARLLHTSEKTVENQRYRLRKKFRLPHRKNLTAFLVAL